MAVYVDRLAEWGWRNGASCHLIADSNEELHAFAQLIGLKRAWFQKKTVPHYDLSAFFRRRALEQGAVALSYRQMARKIIEWKQAAAAQLKPCTTPAEREAVRAVLWR